MRCSRGGLKFAPLAVSILALSSVLLSASRLPAQSSGPRIEISFPESLGAKALDGHILLGISKNKETEPRFQLDEMTATSAQFFGLDVDGWKPGSSAVIDSTSLGYPIKALDKLPAGDYYVQAVLNIYETYHRADGHVVKLPPDMGEGQQWNRKPGNIFNKPVLVHFDPQHPEVIRLSLTERIPAIQPPADTKYIKHIRVQSKLLTAFWGRPVYLGAIVLLPEGFETHPTAHYPLLVSHGHFQEDWLFFNPEAPKESAGNELT